MEESREERLLSNSSHTSEAVSDNERVKLNTRTTDGERERERGDNKPYVSAVISFSNALESFGNFALSGSINANDLQPCGSPPVAPSPLTSGILKLVIPFLVDPTNRASMGSRYALTVFVSPTRTNPACVAAASKSDMT